MRKILPALLIAILAGTSIVHAMEGLQLRDENLPEMFRIEYRAEQPAGSHIVFNYHDGRNYCAVELAKPVIVIEVTNGKERRTQLKIAADKSGDIYVRAGRVFVQSNGAAGAADINNKIGGKYGAVLKAPFAKLAAHPAEPVFFTDDFMRTGEMGESWWPHSGNWSIRNERDIERSANPFRCIARSEGVGLMTSGSEHWHEYAASVNLAVTTGTAGLAFAVRDSQNYHLFRISAEGSAGGAELVEVREGKERVITHAETLLLRGSWYRMSVNTAADSIECLIDGKRMLEAKIAAPAGGVGLYVQNAEETLFDDVVVSSIHLKSTRLAPLELFSDVFESDNAMENWASLWGAWRPQTISRKGQPAKKIFWHKGDFFSDVSIATKPGAPEKAWRLEFLLLGDGRDSASASALIVSSDGKKTTWTIRTGGKETSKEHAITSGQNIEFALEKNTLVGFSGDKRVIEAPAAKPAGRSIGISADGIKLDLHDVTIRTANVFDYLFESAPVEWLPRTGEWQITNRWACDPRWSWLGGYSDHVAQMWSKRTFSGDQTIEFFAALKMKDGAPAGIPGGQRGYPHVGDINLTFCGDGQNIESGYQVIFAGWGNKWTRLLREGEVVAGSGEENHIITGNFHHRWFHIKVRKQGGLIQLFLDDQLVRQFKDPNPLGGGHVALWTIDNGIMIARVRIYSEKTELLPFFAQPKPAEFKPREAEKPTGRKCLVDEQFIGSLGGWSGRDGEQGAVLSLQRELVVSNKNSGGSFGVTMYKGDYNLCDFPVVRLDYTPGEKPVKLNMFAVVDGLLVEIPLTAPVSKSAIALKKIDGVTFHGAKEPRTLQIDLLELLNEKLKNKNQSEPIKVTELYLASESTGYILGGMGGNRAGTSFSVRRFIISER